MIQIENTLVSFDVFEKKFCVGIFLKEILGWDHRAQNTPMTIKFRFSGAIWAEKVDFQS